MEAELHLMGNDGSYAVRMPSSQGFRRCAVEKLWTKNEWELSLEGVRTGTVISIWCGQGAPLQWYGFPVQTVDKLQGKLARRLILALI